MQLTTLKRNVSSLNLPDDQQPPPLSVRSVKKVFTSAVDSFNIVP